jgi:hypothetical protein
MSITGISPRITKFFLDETLNQGPDYGSSPVYGASASEIAFIHELLLVFFYKVSPCDAPYRHITISLTGAMPGSLVTTTR